ncbi:FxsA family protein [Pelagibacteraceae bacterium]|nr:FxsA family protein [Pelagibacteraceae bacterium]
MNTLLLIIIGLPAIEILVMIKIGQQIGAFNTILTIFLTASIGIYYAKIESINTIKSGMANLYKNKIPFYEILSGASITVAAVLLILPGFISDTIGFLLLIPFVRKIIINSWLKNKYHKNIRDNNAIIDAEIIEKEKEKNEL